MNSLVTIGRASAFMLAAFRAALRALPRPGLWLRPFGEVLIGSLPLAAIAGLTIGLVIWLHTRGVLARTGGGAEELLPAFLAAAVVLELAPVAAGLILASRSGASFAAELAAMRANEQLDAMALLGASPMNRLIGPRMLAAAITAPLLTIVVVSLALGGGFVAEWAGSNTSWLRYSTAMLSGVTFWEAAFSIGKTLAFGGLIAVLACRQGIVTGEGSEGVGHAATRGVVLGIVVVLVADTIFAMLFQAIFS